MTYDILSNSVQIVSDDEGLHWKTFKKGEGVMKRILLVITAVTLLLTFASLSEAWQVNIKNSCNKDVTIDATGEHLFWRQKDCNVTVAKGTTGNCQLPGAICPVEILGVYFSGGSWYDLNSRMCGGGIACCWNVNVEVIQLDKDSCRLELR